MEDPQKLIEAINQLNERLKAVESAKTSPEASSPEGMRDRQEREREGRKGQNEAERYLKKTGSGATPVSPRRYEEIKHRYTQMHSPAQGVQKSRATPFDPSVVYFYMWKDGKIHQVALMCKSQPSEIV